MPRVASGMTATEIEREPIYYPPGTRKPKPPLPVWKVRETGSQQRKTVKVKKTSDAELQQQRHGNTMEQLSARQSQRIQFRRIVRQESVGREQDVLALRRGERYRQSGERFAGTTIGTAFGFERSPTPGYSILGGIVRVVAIVFALAILYLLVSRGQAAGNAIQKVGYFLNNVTSGKPLFTKTT